jgi:hypothetical protein
MNFPYADVGGGAVGAIILGFFKEAKSIMIAAAKASQKPKDR